MLRHSFSAIMTLLVAIIPAQPPTARDESIKRVLQSWQGTWQTVAVEENGVTVAADKLKDQSFFVGVESFLIRRGQALLQAGALQLDPSASPPTVNVLVKQGQLKDTTLLGIYSLEGDSLKICFDPQGQNRPKELKSPAGSGFALVTFQRVRAKNETIDITGTYKAESTSIEGRVMESTAVIERRGDAYLITFKKDDTLIYAAMGIRQGDSLSLSWGNRGQIGVSAYKIEPGPRLVGHYTTVGGPGLLMKEVLTPEKRID